MGWRTVVVLYNDQAGDWMNDPRLGEKIMTAANQADGDIGYGRVVECAHADQQTMAVIDGYHMDAVAFGNWARGETPEQIQEKLLRNAAAKLGFRLVRQSTKANMGWTGSDDVAR